MSKPQRLSIFVILGCLWLCVANGALANARAASDVLSLGSESMVQLKPSHVQYLVQGENLTTDQVLQQGTALDWQSPDKPSINLGKFSESVWVRFSLKNETEVDLKRTLEIRWIHLAELDMYHLREDGEVRQYSAGLKRPRESLYRENRNILLPIEMRANEQSEVLLRIKTSFIVFLPMFIWDEDQRQQAEFTQYIWYSLAFGILAAMMLYNASLYVFTRDSSYFYYSLYVLGIILYELGATGIGVHAIWGSSEWMRLNGFALSIYSSFLFACFFVRHFLDLNECGGWLLRLNTIVSAGWAIAIVDLLLGSNAMRPVMDLFSLITCIGALYTSIYLWAKGNVSARYFTIAWSFLILSTFLTVLMMDGAIPNSALTEYGQMAGFVMEVLMLSFAMAERINRERVSKEHAQADALHLQVLIGDEREAKMSAQGEVLRIQKKTNEELEGRVTERTQELERTMTNLEIANRELAKLSVTDPLTKVHNRRYFDEVLHREIQRSQRTQQPLSLILVDIDHFKQFNDEYGHLVGDDCLRLVAAVLQREVSRVSDLVARYGGEEFVVVLPDSSEEEAFLVAEKLRTAISDLQFIYRGKLIPISASFGVAGKVPTESCNSVTLIEAADKALYQAKDKGRNCCVSAQLAAV